MKTLTFLFAGFFLALNIFGQNPKLTKEHIDRFYKTKTLIVLEDNPLMEYNFIIQDVIKNEWRLTEYEFIQYKEFEEKRMDPQYSFLIMLIDGFERDKTKARYKFLHILLGGDYFRINQMPDLGGIPIAYESVPEEEYIYKMTSILRFMQEHIRIITEDPSLISSNMFKYHKDNMKNIKDKTLYLLPDEVSKEVNTEKRIKKVYPYDFEFVTKEQIKEAIENKREDIVFLHKVGPEGTKIIARCYKIIMGAGDPPQLFYFDYHMIDKKHPDGMLEDDFDNIAKGKTFNLF